MPRKKKPEEQQLPEPELEPASISKVYMCGYVVNHDMTIMLHIRNLNSDKIDYYVKVSKFVNAKEPVGVKNLMCDIVTLAACHHCSQVYTPKDKDTDTVVNAIVLAYPDDFGKIHIILVDNNQNKINTMINRIASTYKINPSEIVARTIGTIYNVKVEDLPKCADFATIAQGSDVSTSLEEYFIHNETIQCTLI